MSDHPGVVVTLPEIYRQVLETDKKVDNLSSVVASLAQAQERMDAQDKRIDAVDETLSDHDGRLDRVEQSQAVAQALVRPRISGWQVAGTVGTLVGSLGSFVALVVLMDKILSAYNG